MAGIKQATAWQQSSTARWYCCWASSCTAACTSSVCHTEHITCSMQRPSSSHLTDHVYHFNQHLSTPPSSHLPDHLYHFNQHLPVVICQIIFSTSINTSLQSSDKSSLPLQSTPPSSHPYCFIQSSKLSSITMPLVFSFASVSNHCYNIICL